MMRGKWAVVVDIAVPVGLYYLCSGLGYGDQVGLLAAAGGGAVLAVVGLLRTRQMQMLPLVMALAAVLSVVVGLLDGDGRLLLVREAYVGIPLGLAFLASALTRDPVLNKVYRAMLTNAPGADERWREKVRDDPAFRRQLALSTATWGVVGVVGSVAQVVLAYALPVSAAVVATNVTVVAIVVVASVASAPFVNGVRARLRQEAGLMRG
jgi:hypothetical protein